MILRYLMGIKELGIRYEGTDLVLTGWTQIRHEIMMTRGLQPDMSSFWQEEQ